MIILERDPYLFIVVENRAEFDKHFIENDPHSFRGSTFYGADIYTRDIKYDKPFPWFFGYERSHGWMHAEARVMTKEQVLAEYRQRIDELTKLADEYVKIVKM